MLRSLRMASKRCNSERDLGETSADESGPQTTTLSPCKVSKGDQNFAGVRKRSYIEVIEDDTYKMDHEYRGVAIIFNHEHFEGQGLEMRRGTSMDKTVAENTLHDLGFAVKCCDDLSRKEIQRCLKTASAMDHTQNDCIVVVVLTHGDEEGRLYAKDLPYFRQELYEPFLGNPTLLGKPKIFIIQACWGTESFASHRDVESGSHFIQGLMLELQKYAFELDLLTIVLRNQRVMENTEFYLKEGNRYQVPSLLLTCGKRIQFTHKVLPCPYPEKLLVKVKSCIKEIDMAGFTRKQKDDTLEEIKEYGVEKLRNVPGDALEHVRSAALWVEHLELQRATYEQLRCLPFMQNLKHLKALTPLNVTRTKGRRREETSNQKEGSESENVEVDGSVSSSEFSDTTEQLPSLLNLPLMHLESSLEVKSLEWLLMGTKNTLKTLCLWVGTPLSPKAKSKVEWPRNCDNLDEILQKCNLRKLKKVQLLRNKKGLFHDDRQCETQLNKIKNVYAERNVEVVCEIVAMEMNETDGKNEQQETLKTRDMAVAMVLGGAARAALPPLLALALASSLLAVTDADPTPKYSPPTLDYGYTSRNDYHDQGMQTLYNIARKILRGVQKPEPFPPGLLFVEGGEVKVDVANPGHIVSYYAGVVAMVVLGLVVALALPCAGFLWCLCGSGCNCSSGKARERGVRKPALDVELSREERNEPGPCFVPAALAVTVCVILAGSSLVISTNAYMDRGIIGYPDHIKRGTNDVALFADNSILEVNTFFDTNYLELSTALSKVLDECQTEINNMISGIFNALPLDTLNAIPDGLVAISQDLEELEKKGGEIVSSSTQIVNVLKEVAKGIKEKCTSPECESYVDSLITEQIPPLPDVSSIVVTLGPYIDPSFKASIQNGVNQLKNVEAEVKKTVTDTANTIKSSIEDAHTELQKTSRQLIEQVDNVRSSIDDINKEVDETSENLEPYERYKPVWFICLTTTLLMLFTIAAFLVGLVGDRLCEAAKDPEHNQVINLFDTLISKNRGDSLPGNISYYIKSCQRNEPIYKVLQLDSSINVDEILDVVNKFSFEQFMEQLDKEQSKIKQEVLIPAEIKQKVEALENSAVATFDLKDIQTKVDEGNAIAGKLKPREWADNLKALSVPGVNFENEIKSLEGLEQQVATLQDGAQKLTVLIEKLQKDIRLGANSFKDALSSFLAEIQDANDYIISEVDFVNIADTTTTDFKNEVTDYLNYVVRRVRNEALRCGPLHQVYNSLVIATCDEVLSPWVSDTRFLGFPVYATFLLDGCKPSILKIFKYKFQSCIFCNKVIFILLS
ncbi:Caspase-1 [Frankliniella fusca]|uniref:Caspase-1 n=1 Tax=Frankliniella fusca TaxID=407009 RepID=A0AAE1L754_9NEOP|nr:Caspase-1 [Frankliniella fusca]